MWSLSSISPFISQRWPAHPDPNLGLHTLRAQDGYWSAHMCARGLFSAPVTNETNGANLGLDGLQSEPVNKLTTPEGAALLDVWRRLHSPAYWRKPAFTLTAPEAVKHPGTEGMRSWVVENAAWWRCSGCSSGLEFWNEHKNVIKLNLAADWLHTHTCGRSSLVLQAANIHCHMHLCVRHCSVCGNGRR